MAHVPEVKVLTILGDFTVPVTAESTIGHIRLKVPAAAACECLLLPILHVACFTAACEVSAAKVHEWKPEYQLAHLELVCCDKDAAGPEINQTMRPRYLTLLVSYSVSMPLTHTLTHSLTTPLFMDWWWVVGMMTRLWVHCGVTGTNPITSCRWHRECAHSEDGAQPGNIELSERGSVRA